MSTISIGTYHEPFFMGGVILTYDISNKLTAKLIFANDYYYFSDPNALGDKAFGSLINYRPSKSLTFTYNNFLLNRTPANSKGNAYRFYNNLNALYSKKNLQLLASIDFGFENNVHLDTLSIIRHAFFSSGELAIKYRFSPFWAVYSRIDYFDDRNGAISNLDRTYKNKYGKIQGLSCYSFTFGGEINPTAGSYLRFEARVINADSKLLWFKNLDGKMSYQRSEILITIGVNFTSGNLIK